MSPINTLCNVGRQMMAGLPEHVSDGDIEEMFTSADTDNDGKIVWEEFLKMITPVNIQVTLSLLHCPTLCFIGLHHVMNYLEYSRMLRIASTNRNEACMKHPMKGLNFGEPVSL